MQVAFWRAARVGLACAVVACLLTLGVFLVIVGLAIAEGRGDLFVRAATGAVVSVTLNWLLSQAARYAHRRKTDLAVARCAAAIRCDPLDVTGLVQQGLAHAHQREYAAAIAHYDAAIALDSVEPSAHVGRINAYTALGQCDRVIAEFTDTIARDATDALAHAGRATAYNALGRWDPAVADATTAIQFDPALYLGHAARGYAHWQRGNFSWVLKLIAITWMLATLPLGRRDRFDWRTPTGTRTDHERAVADFTEALRLNPAAWDCYAGRAMAYRALGDHAKAMADDAARGAVMALKAPQGTR